MNDLINISEKGLLSARDLYLGLGLNKSQWSRWYVTNIQNNEFFKENVDWTGVRHDVEGNETMDFAISIEFAKHIAMMARTEKSHEYRNYFIECEKKLKHQDSYMIVDPILRAKVWIHEEEVRQQLQAQNQIMAPKANYYDGLVDSGHLTGIRETAKELGMKQNKFVSWLISKGYMYRDKKKKLNPYSQYVGDYFELKDKSTSAWSGTQPFVTVEGKKRFRIRLLKENLITA